MKLLPEIHWSSQYLVAAAKSFLEEKPDDSHTNLGFNPETASLYTRDLQGRGRLEYAIAEKKLRWDELGLEWQLEGRTHPEILRALHKAFADSGMNSAYRFDLHYELPYDLPKSGYTYTESGTDTLAYHIAQRTLGQNGMRAISEKYGQEVRVWPHHFDSGLFLNGLREDELSVGLGLAIPDALSDHYYFFISAYLNGVAVEPSGFGDAPGNGRWISGGFKGAILPTIGIGAEEAEEFLIGCLQMFIERS